MHPADELAELVADLRAVLDDVRLRGIASEPLDAPLPEAIPVEPASADPAATASSADPSSARLPSADPSSAHPSSDVAPAPAPLRAPPATPPPATVEPAPPPPAARNAWSEIAATARDTAEASSGIGGAGLTRIRDDLGDCRRCELCTGRRHIVFGVGDPEADLLVLGEAPGAQEDQTGEPFVGPAGQMLDRMLQNVLGLERRQVYITNVVKCRPPRNRNPLPDEVASCRPFLDRQIDAVRPRVLLVLGAVAFKTLFDTNEGIMKNRGRWTSYRDIPVMPTLHPAYLLRTPGDKRLVFEDLKAVARRYDELGGRRS